VNPLFVVGAFRSGTSYLARCLALAADVAYWEEGGLLPCLDLGASLSITHVS